MNDDVTVINATDGVLSRRCATALRSTADLVSTLLSALPSEALRRLESLINGGAAVGIETLTDASAWCTVRLIAIECEGARHVIANVRSNHPTTGAH